MKFAQLHFLVIEADVPFLLKCLPQLQMELTLSHAESQQIRKGKNDSNFISQLEEHPHETKYNNFKLT